MKTNRLPGSFFIRDALDICPDLIGKTLCRRFDDGTIIRRTILEIEAYRGEEDRACHASKGRTRRTEIMYSEGGHVYVYLIYGMYWMLNIVTGPRELPQAILIRGLENCSGPGRVGRLLEIDASFYGENLTNSGRIWVEDNGLSLPFTRTERVGVAYAGAHWANIPWRFVANGY